MYNYKALCRSAEIYKDEREQEQRELLKMDFITSIKNIKYYKLQIKTNITREIDEIIQADEITSDFLNSFYKTFYNKKDEIIIKSLYNLESLDNKTITLNDSSFLSLELKDYAINIYNTIINKKYIELKKTFTDAKEETKEDTKENKKEGLTKKQKNNIKFFLITWLVLYIIYLMLVM